MRRIAHLKKEQPLPLPADLAASLEKEYGPLPQPGYTIQSVEAGYFGPVPYPEAVALLIANGYTESPPSQRIQLHKEWTSGEPLYRGKQREREYQEWPGPRRPEDALVFLRLGADAYLLVGWLRRMDEGWLARSYARRDLHQSRWRSDQERLFPVPSLTLAVSRRAQAINWLIRKCEAVIRVRAHARPSESDVALHALELAWLLYCEP